LPPLLVALVPLPSYYLFMPIHDFSFI
jgi:hypothetical protein